MRRFLVTAGVATLAMLSTGCSGNGNPRSGSAPTTSATIPPGASPSSTFSPSGTASTIPVDTRFTGVGSTAFCDLLRTYNEDFARLFPSINDPDASRTLFMRIRSAIDKAAAIAPAEIRPDVRVLAAAYDDESAALDKVNYDFTRVPPEAAAKFQSSDVQSASTRLAAYSQNVCKIS